MKILTFGSCNIDCVYKVPHIVNPGETIAAESLTLSPGGKGLNQALAIAKADVPVYLAGCIGKEDTMLRPLLQTHGVDLTYLNEVNTQTGQAIIQVDSLGENSIFIFPGANGSVSKEHIDHVLQNFERDDILLLQNEISNLQYLIDAAYEVGMRIILNPSPFENQLSAIDLKKLFCIILNETEASQWVNSEHPFDFFLLVQQKCPTLNIVLTLGKKGSIYFKDGKYYRQQAYKTNVIDTTAAGDTFTGYYVAGIYNNLNTADIFQLASAAAAITVSKIGAASSIPSIKEVNAHLPSMVQHCFDNLAEQKDVILSYITAHLADVKLIDIANLLSYSEDYAGKWIQHHFEINFSNLLQRERCRIAADLLTTTNLPINEIIEKIGYNNGSFFRKVFYKYYRMLPLEYRNQKNVKETK